MYRTVVSFEILSEEPIPAWMEPDRILCEADTGSFVLGRYNEQEHQVSREEMARLLIEFGSEPEFFSLEGELTEDLPEEDT